MLRIRASILFSLISLIYHFPLTTLAVMIISKLNIQFTVCDGLGAVCRSNYAVRTNRTMMINMLR